MLRLGATHTFGKSLEYRVVYKTIWMHTEPRAKHQMSSPANPCLLAFETGSLVDPETSYLPISSPGAGVRDPSGQIWLFKWVLGINWSRRLDSMTDCHRPICPSGFRTWVYLPSLVAVPEALWDIHQSLSFLSRLLASTYTFLPEWAKNLFIF